MITVTPGQSVLFPAGSLQDGQHVSLMGADGPGKAEVAVDELERAQLFCDDWEQASHGGELAAGRRGGRRDAGAGDRARRGAGRRRGGPPQRREITLFDSTGLAIQDLAIAIAAYAKAGELDLPGLEL